MHDANEQWITLQKHFDDIKNVHMRDLFVQNTRRFEQFSLHAAGLFLDYSKNRMTDQTMSLLVDYAKQCDLTKKIKCLFGGERINNTEGRAALHVALRNLSIHTMAIDGVDVMPKVHETLDAMEAFADQVQCENRFTDIVNIGIGGSDLGPALVTQALAPYHQNDLRFHFVANVDSSHIADVISRLDPKTTLFIVATKSFRTQETIYNAQTARLWLTEHLGEAAVADHFVAVTAQEQAARDFGVRAEWIFPIWDWVGGRFSVWSAIGLPVVLAIGMDNFRAFLSGAQAMDEHFKTAPLDQNMPVILGLLSLWYINFFGALSRAVIPYDARLARLPAYLQQSHMESNGKSVRVDGELVDYHTSAVIFGTTGSNGQHAFHQLLHQGTQLVPVDFIVARESHNPVRAHHEHLLANCLSQSQALMLGNDNVGHQAIPGNKPSNTIVLPKLSPEALGSLLALYEHKIFVQGVLWGINSFDQWGVELGKRLAGSIFDDIQHRIPSAEHDSSTTGLIKLFTQ